MPSVIGAYELLEELDSDELSIVWKARRITTGDFCTLEVLQSEVSQQQGMAEAFLTAGRQVAKLGPHQHLQRVHGADRDEETGSVYIASDWVPGPTAEHLLDVEGPQHHERVALVLEHLARAVGTMHERSICHGQLHPRNLVLGGNAEGEPILALRGFGRGAVLERAAESVRLLLHPYAAPEQLGWTPEGATKATDVWALGLVTLTLLVGADPKTFWEARSASELAQRINQPVPRRPSGRSLDWAQQLPTGFDDWFAQCVVNEPDKRLSDFAAAARHAQNLLAPSSKGHTQSMAAFDSSIASPPPFAPSPPAPSPPAPSPPAPSPPQPNPPPEASPTPQGSPAAAPAKSDSTLWILVAIALGGVALVGMLALVGAVVGVYLMAYTEQATSEGDFGNDDREGPDDPYPAEHQLAPIPVTQDDPTWGDGLAPATIVEFSDFECPFCGRVNPTLEQLKEEYGPDKLRLVWKHNPLPFHRNARGAHEASVAVFYAAGGGQEGSRAFFKFHDLAFANRKSLTESNFETWAEESGVTVRRYQSELTTRRTKQKVDDDLALARRVGARGTPNFRINGYEVSGAQPFSKFKEVIDRELEEARRLVASGTKAESVYVQRVRENFTAPSIPTATTTAKPPVDETVWKVPVHMDDPVRGPSDALVTIVEWSDFQCPFCARVNPTLTRVLEKYPNDVRLVWKDNALPFHQRAKPAAVLARVAYEARGDTGFWQAHDLLFANQRDLSDAQLESLCTKVGISWSTVQPHLVSGRHLDKIQDNMDLAVDLEAKGTPHFFINGVRLTGAQPFEKFDELIQKRLTAARILVAGGTSRSRVYDEIMRGAKGAKPPQTKAVPPPGPNSPYKGSTTAPVVIQVFSDFQCPFCNRAVPTLEQIAREYPTQVRIVWRNLPLDFHKDAPLAAEAAHEAFVQRGNAGFWRFYDELFANQREPNGLERANLETIAQRQGLDMNRFRRALDNHTHRAHVEADKEVAKRAGITGTPGFSINQYYISGAQPYSQFRRIIELALKESQ